MVFFVGFSQMHHQTQMIPDAPAGAGALALEVPIAAACRLEVDRLVTNKIAAGRKFYDM